MDIVNLLSPLEVKVWELRHLPRRDVAAKLGIKPSTVSTCKTRIDSKIEQYEAAIAAAGTSREQYKQEQATAPGSTYLRRLADLAPGAGRITMTSSLQDVLGFIHENHIAHNYAESLDLCEQERKVLNCLLGGLTKRTLIASILDYPLDYVDSLIGRVRRMLIKDLIATAGAAGYLSRSRERGKKLKILGKPGGHVVLKVEGWQKSRADISESLAGCRLARYSVEGDSEYIVTRAKYDELKHLWRYPKIQTGGNKGG